MDNFYRTMVNNEGGISYGKKSYRPFNDNGLFIAYVD